VTWGLYTWQLNYGKLTTPLIIRELLLKAAQVKQIQHHTETELSASLRTWGGLCSGYHNDQLNLCKMYNNQNPCYMIGGLQNNSLLTERAASTIYTHIISERAKGELLVSVYSRIYEANKPVVDFKALRRQRKLNKKLMIGSDTEEFSPTDNTSANISKPATLTTSSLKPFKCNIDHIKVKKSWGGLVTDTQFYDAARKHWAGLTEWCRDKWLPPTSPGNASWSTKMRSSRKGIDSFSGFVSCGKNTRNWLE